MSARDTGSLDIAKMQEHYREFIKAREWDNFQSPKNLSMALAVEVSELMEHFQWLTETQSINLKNDPARLSGVKEEVADVFIYLMRLADLLEIDLTQAFWEKFKRNEEKYPVEKGRELALKIKSFS